MSVIRSQSSDTPQRDPFTPKVFSPGPGDYDPRPTIFWSPAASRRSFPAITLEATKSIALDRRDGPGPCDYFEATFGPVKYTQHMGSDRRPVTVHSDSSKLSMRLVSTRFKDSNSVDEIYGGSIRGCRGVSDTREHSPCMSHRSVATRKASLPVVPLARVDPVHALADTTVRIYGSTRQVRATSPERNVKEVNRRRAVAESIFTDLQSHFDGLRTSSSLSPSFRQRIKGTVSEKLLAQCAQLGYTGSRLAEVMAASMESIQPSFDSIDAGFSDNSLLPNGKPFSELA